MSMTVSQREAMHVITITGRERLQRRREWIFSSNCQQFSLLIELVRIVRLLLRPLQPYLAHYSRALNLSFLLLSVTPAPFCPSAHYGSEIRKIPMFLRNVYRPIKLISRVRGGLCAMCVNKMRAFKIKNYNAQYSLWLFHVQRKFDSFMWFGFSIYNSVTSSIRTRNYLLTIPLFLSWLFTQFSWKFRLNENNIKYSTNYTANYIIF